MLWLLAAVVDTSVSAFDTVDTDLLLLMQLLLVAGQGNAEQIFVVEPGGFLIWQANKLYPTPEDGQEVGITC